MTSDTALSARSLSKFYGKAQVLNDVSFDLRRGEFLTMLGPSGSGKSTTLRIIAGFADPDGGQITINGRDVHGVVPNKRNIGMVFQDYALFPHMTVLENVAYPLEARGVGKTERHRTAAEMLEIVNLAAMANRFPRQLSGGQQQRVALARALVFKPEIVLLDEPLGALDRKLRGEMQIEILRIVRSVGATVISVTHDQEEALMMSDRIALFQSGGIAQIGTPRDLFDRPASRFVAEFMGESNILTGSLAAQNGTLHLVGETYRLDVGAQHASASGLQSAVGSQAHWILRPGQLSVLPQNEPVPFDWNAIPGTVGEVIYLGTELLTTVRLAGSSDLKVRSSIYDQPGRPLKAGDAVRIAWRKDAGVILTN
jgi:putative spermidine/putrescine transport system ATP-binding protein